MTTELKERSSTTDGGFDDEVAHYADPPYPPKVALCGAKLRGVVQERTKPICKRCAAIRDERNLDRLRDVHGQHVMN